MTEGYSLIWDWMYGAIFRSIMTIIYIFLRRYEIEFQNSVIFRDSVNGITKAFKFRFLQKIVEIREKT